MACRCAASAALRARVARPLLARPQGARPQRLLRRPASTTAPTTPKPEGTPKPEPPKAEPEPPPLTPGRLAAIGLAAVCGIGGGYFIGTAVRNGLKPPTPAQLEQRQRQARRAEELKQLEADAAQGDAEAAHELGVCYATADRGLRQDLPRSVEYYRAAAEAGHAGARCRLGAAYRTGCGVEVDMAVARQHFEAAAAMGDAEAQFNLAVLIEQELAQADEPPQPAEPGQTEASKPQQPKQVAGAGGTKAEREQGKAERARVFELYSQAGAGGFAPALFNLGMCHYHGYPPAGPPRHPSLSVCALLHIPQPEPALCLLGSCRCCVGPRGGRAHLAARSRRRRRPLRIQPCHVLLQRRRGGQGRGEEHGDAGGGYEPWEWQGEGRAPANHARQDGEGRQGRRWERGSA